MSAHALAIQAKTGLTVQGDIESRRENLGNGTHRHTLSGWSPALPPDSRTLPNAGLAFHQLPILPVSRGAAFVQSKLHVGQANDPLEAEADQVADRIVNIQGPGTQLSTSQTLVARKCADCAVEDEDDKHVQPKFEVASTTQTRAITAPDSVADTLSQSGNSLDSGLRSYFEPQFGRSFSDVRVHTDPAAARSARAIGAKAYTFGKNIAFAAGQYEPQTRSGRWLLAHELAHVVQQSGGSGADGLGNIGPVQRKPDDAPDALGGKQASDLEQQDLPNAVMKPIGAAAPPNTDKVKRIVFSCKEMQVRVETASKVLVYELESCSLPIGEYLADVRINRTDFNLFLPPDVSRDQRFDFSYRVNPGQENPAVLLHGQQKVTVQVVEQFSAPVPAPDPKAPQPKPECVVKLKDRQLVAPASASKPLFKPLSFDATLWSQSIPLGEFGWVDVNAKASGGLSGTLAGHYGPGMLTDICLTHQVGGSSGSAPIKHPLLGPGSHADVSSMVVGGRAHFNLPAGASITVNANGKLVVSGDYLGKFEVAAIEGKLSAMGKASLRGSIDANVEVLAKFTRSSATLQSPDPLLPIELAISKSSLEKIDLAAEVGLQGRAAVAFALDASAALRFAGFELWRDTWHFQKEAGLGIHWVGGLKYSPNPGVHWNMGKLAAHELDDIDNVLIDNEEEAEVAQEDILGSLLQPAQATTTVPDGLKPGNALPFIWHKPIELYPKTAAIPNADDPKSLDRDDGPTKVRHTVGNRSQFNDVGVSRSNWPFQGKKFQYIPYAEREEPEKTRLRGLLDRWGFDRSGTDVDHVHELQFGGADRFGNLWPADNSANRSAGARHANQLDNYAQQLGNLSGRHFVIARIEV